MAKRQANKGLKEAEKLLNEKVVKRPLRTKERLYAITDSINEALLDKEERIAKLLRRIDELYPDDSTQRGLFDGISSMSMDTAYALYLQNNNSALIVELQGLLERFCINALTDILPIDDTAQSIIAEMLDKKTLKDVASYFETYQIWSHDDVEFAKDITNLRNGIAHKNAEIVSRSKLVNSDGQSRHYESIHIMMSKVDCSEYIVRTISLMIKATGLGKPSFIKQPRLFARYNIYTSLACELYSLFLTNPYAKGHDPRIEAYINEKLSRAYIVASEELVDKLQIFRKEVLKFHKLLDDGDEEKAIELHKKLGMSLENIRLSMRNDLNVDGGEREWIEKPFPIDIKPYIKRKE